MIDMPDRTLDAISPTQSISQPISGRLKSNNFDGLRLIFAGMVVIFHIGLLSESAILYPLHEYVSSLAAVQAFFFVSGFLVIMSYENSHTLLSYAKKRFFRIAPAYCAVVLLSAFLLVFMSTLSPVNYFMSDGWRSYVISNLMLSNFAFPSLPGVFQDNYEPAVNGSLWTIKIEVMFYCTVPIIVTAVRRFGYQPVLATIFGLSVIWHFGFAYLAQLSDNDLFARLAKQLPGQLSFFAGGAWAYYRTRENLSPPHFLAAVTAALAYAFAEGLVLTVIAPFCITTMVYWAAITVPQMWSAHNTGDYSYGIYLYHFPIAQTFVALGFFRTSPVLALICVCLATAFAAYLSWHLLEKRMLRFAHRRGKLAPAK